MGHLGMREHDEDCPVASATYLMVGATQVPFPGLATIINMKKFLTCDSLSFWQLLTQCVKDFNLLMGSHLCFQLAEIIWPKCIQG